MTLLISAKSTDGLVVTADGRSNLISSSGHSVTTDALQKILPHATCPIAIAHHGENVIAGTPASTLIAKFLAAVASEDLDAIACRFLQELDAHIVATLTANSLRQYCGFWVMGAAGGGFIVYEVDWCKTEHGIQRKITPHGDLLLGGDCASPIKQYLKKPIDSKLSYEKLMRNAHAYAVDVSDWLYEEVMKASPKSCGGHKHQLLIGTSGTSWIIQPAQHDTAQDGESAGAPSPPVS